MTLKDLKPVGQLAQRNGAKILLYGPPGTAKTPKVAELSNAVMCCVEQGLSSVRTATIPAWSVHGHANLTPLQAFDEFFKWSVSSKEAEQFDTYIIDSLTHLCNIVLDDAKKRRKDGRQAYGDLAESIMQIVHAYTALQKNVIYIAQMATEELPVPGQGFLPEPKTYTYNRPFFPGKKLEKEIPHNIDEILYVHHCQRPDGVYGPAIATTDTGTAMARSRCGKLNPLEPFDLNYLLSKINP